MVARSKKSASKEKAKPRRGRGRPPYEPTAKERRQVTAMAGYGMPHEEIARAIGVCPKSIRKHFREELDKGHALASAKVLESLFQMATTGKVVAAAIWWTKARLGWREGQDLNVTAEGMARQIRQSMSEIDAVDDPDG